MIHIVVVFASVRYQSIVLPVLAIHMVVVFACARYQSIVLPVSAANLP